MWITFVFLCGYADGVATCRYWEPSIHPEQGLCEQVAISEAYQLADHVTTKGVMSLGGLEAKCLFVEAGKPEVPA